MKQRTKLIIAASVAGLLTSSALFNRLDAAEAKKDDPIKLAMQTYHKAPKGTDPVCKRASDGKATPEEIKKLVAAYKTMAMAKPPKGAEASWKEKTGKLLAATEDLEKGKPDAVAKYKEAVNCKACHSVHKPD